MRLHPRAAVEVAGIVVEGLALCWVDARRRLRAIRPPHPRWIR